MFARVAQAIARAVVMQRLVIEFEQVAQLVCQRRIAGIVTGIEILSDNAGKPRPALRSTANHHGVRARLCERVSRICESNECRR